VIASYKVAYGSKMLVKDGQTIERGDNLFEWDPFTLPIIAEKSGVVKYVDLVSGIAVRDETDDATGMTQKIVTDWRAALKGSELAPKIIVTDDKGEMLTREDGNPIAYAMSVDAILSVEDGQEIKAGDILARIPREGGRSKDITGGLPRVAELFEAVAPKITRSSQKLMAMCALAKTTKISAALRLNRLTRLWQKSSTWCQKASTSPSKKVISSRRVITSWMATLRRMIFLR